MGLRVVTATVPSTLIVPSQYALLKLELSWSSFEGSEFWLETVPTTLIVPSVWPPYLRLSFHGLGFRAWGCDCNGTQHCSSHQSARVHICDCALYFLYLSRFRNRSNVPYASKIGLTCHQSLVCPNTESPVSMCISVKASTILLSLKVSIPCFGQEAKIVDYLPTLSMTC